MHFKIRNLEKLDMQFLRDMVYESAFVPEGQKPFPRAILDEPSVSKYVDGWGEQSGDIGLIAEVDAQQLGAIWLRLFDEEQKCFGDSQTPELGMAILQEYRGKGFGKALLRALEMQALHYGYRKICLSVDPRNPARFMYEQAGYVHEGWFETYWTMEKELD
ncbi:GNAT superfamily N-acetyltransferase [Sporosarcina luteola]|nr:GNAT superfamily N-acetyltransferase [Sporosarcina luteola]